MNVVVEPARETPVVAEVDVCVVGGSTTGVCAAVAAARCGATAAVIEANGFFGGVATAGLVNIWHSEMDTVGGRQIIGGLTTELIDRLGRRGAVARGSSAASAFRLNSEQLKIELDELVVEAGVTPFLHTRFVAPVVEAGVVTAAIVEDKTGRRAIRAKVFVDATGDGDVIARSGLPWEVWADLQPPTMCMRVRGLGEAGLGAVTEAVFSEGAECPVPHGFIWGAPVPGMADELMIAGTRVPGANCAEADSLTAAEIEGRRQVRAILDVVRAGVAGGSGVVLSGLPATIGIRETRHARCLHRLTEAEVLEGVRFDDAIANGSYRVDVHHSDRPGLTFRYLDGREDYVVPGRPGVNGRWRPARDIDPTFYQIPYRSLVPQGSINVLVAGRLMDADRGAYGAVRVMVNCNQTGQAAGIAGALAVMGGGDVSEVDTVRLRDVLADQGAIVL